MLVYEGGFVNSPKDPGGATNKGVTQRTLSLYLKRPASVAELKAMPDSLVAAIYRSQYWDGVAGDQLPAGVDLFCFDSAVNCGVRHGAVWLQQALGVAEDGAIGAGTLHALADANVAMVLEDMRQEREAYYRSRPHFVDFGHGWLARLDQVATLATSWVHAAPAAAPVAPRSAPVAAPPPAIAPSVFDAVRAAIASRIMNS